MKRAGGITRAVVEAALARQSAWDLGNDVLYRLCRKHPDHRSDDAIVAKVWLIGRAYAAAIERRRIDLDLSSDEFYLSRVAKGIRGSGIDRSFRALQGLSRPDPVAVVPVHKWLTERFRRISKHDNRSLASKYLHFHFPRAVYIYDARAASAIRRVSP